MPIYVAPRALSALSLGAALGLLASLSTEFAAADTIEPSVTAPTPPREDSRFGQIGTDTAGAPSESLPQGAAGVAATQSGNVTYMSVRADVPVAHAWSVVPQAALLRVAPFTPTDAVSINGYVGGGLVYRPIDGWSIEASTMIGPRAYDVASEGFSLGVAGDIGADWPHDKPPPLSVSLQLAGTHFNWADGLGPAGPDLLQLYAIAELTWRLGSRFTLQPQGMYFVYDHTLQDASGARLGTVSTLARVGSYAPRWLSGMRLGYRVNDWLTPFVEGDEIGYADGIGSGTELLGGLRVQFGKVRLSALGGVLSNRVGGPLVPTAFDLGTVPIVGFQGEVGF